MFDMIRDTIANLRFVDPADLDVKAVNEIARFIAEDAHDLDNPDDVDEEVLIDWLRQNDDQLQWLYEYLTKSTNVIYGSVRG